ncbi:MAG: ABC transporter permease [Planctomycetota bacterium]|jgi:lipoprotein-releasing system permease protein
MYKLLLTVRYLRRKLTPLFALLAVTGCTALVIIVLAVMGGFIDFLKANGHTLIGDVSVHAGMAGFPYYDELADLIRRRPEAEAATPVAIAYGLAKFRSVTKGVQLYGIDAPGFAGATQYADKIYWTRERLETPEYADIKELYGDIDPATHAIRLTIPWDIPAKYHPTVPGIEVNPYNQRTKQGTYRFQPTIILQPLTVTVLPITRQGGVTEPSTRNFVAINEFHSGHIEADAMRLFVPFELLQDMMDMREMPVVKFGPDGLPLTDNDGNFVYDETQSAPARATELHVKAAPGVSTDRLRAAVQETIDAFAATHPLLPVDRLQVQTWQQRNAKTIAAIENERVMMSILFAIISLVNVFLIGIMFYMIVLEKTHDIGILRALGAPAAGVRTIFLNFGAAIGFVGATVGAVAATLIIHYINPIHDFLGRHFNIVIWDKQFYYFDQIPTRLETVEVITIAGIALAASVAGAVIPAIFAARLDPIQALHQE